MATDREGPDYEQRGVMLPRSLWTRVDELCEREGKEPSELVAEGIRLLMARGAMGAPASVGGVRESSATGGVAALAAGAQPAVKADDATATALESQLAGLHDEPLGSDRLMGRLRELMAEIETRDNFIDRHSQKVADLARQVAEALGLKGDDLALVETAALAHDLGKSHVPAEVLGKKGRLSPDEWELVKRYPVFSAEMLAPFAHLTEVVPVVRHHQERWDGSGYPDGLQGDAIPLAAQIVGVCDVYDVLTSDRAYRPALEKAVALKTIEGGSGRLWKPEVAAALIEKVG